MRYMLFLLIVLFGSCKVQNPLLLPISIDLSEKIVSPKQYIIPKSDQEIKIDGNAFEEAWLRAPFTKNFIDIEGEKIPKYNTKVKLLWDENYLYVFAMLEEEHIWADLVMHDAVIFHNNNFEVFIDPSASSTIYGELEINALGTTWDLLLQKPYRVGGKAINTWNIPGLKHAIQFEGTLNNPLDRDIFWSVELAIPMDCLLELKNNPKKLPKEGEQWRMNFSRVEWNHEIIMGKYRRKQVDGKILPEYNWVWSPQKVINMHEPEKWGIVQFTHKAHLIDAKFKKNPNELYRQITFALFREIRFGELQYLMNENYWSGLEIKAMYDKDQYLNAYFYKTHHGFELKCVLPDQDFSYIINEEGVINKIP
ncbi:MAG: carbohydrate-binding family 9-like protein [Saprospiraceae bacterium]|nr:carbohydrate-binding family 9-like protein [Saprospiraceae bacterium]